MATPHRSKSLNNLADTLATLFKESGQHEHLEEAVSLNRKALELVCGHHPGQSIALRNLASTLNTLFNQFGRHEHLDEAISMHREALRSRYPILFRSGSLNKPGACSFLTMPIQAVWQTQGPGRGSFITSRNNKSADTCFSS